MRRAPLIGLVLTGLLAFGCATSEDVPPFTQLDSGLDGQVVVIPGVRRDGGGGRDMGGDMGDDGCLDDPQDVRVLFVMDRSDTMGEFATGGDGLAFNVLASHAAVELLEPLPLTSSAGLLLFPSQTLDEPSCPTVDAFAQQFSFRDPTMMQTLLTDLWSMESLILGKPRARAMQRAAEALTGTDLSDVLVVLFTDSALGCVSGGETDGIASLVSRGARVVTITVGTSSVAASPTTPRIFSRVSEIVDWLESQLDAVRYQCEDP